MKIIRNSIIPIKGCKAINLFGVLFVRKGACMGVDDLTHEKIHTRQMQEMLYVGFYLWYVVEWIVRLFACGFDCHRAYRRISLEREAYALQAYRRYPEYRQHYAWLGYL